MENTFIKYERALEILESHKMDFESTVLPIDQSNRQFLDEDLAADRDFPPFDRVTMDGIAIAYQQYESGRRSFLIERTAAAGTPLATLEDSQNCVEVMTGAMLPENADTVIRYEDMTIENGAATVHELDLRHRQNIHFKGMDIPKGKVIVEMGKQLSSAEINIAASVGKPSLKVKKLPNAVIISTGDELVDIDERPEAHQIRRSNVYGIRNTLEEWGLSADLKHLRDDPEQMVKSITQLLRDYDMLIFTGGVSMGKFDHLPNVLKQLEVERHFHKIKQRPGKPFWFGTSANGKRIFALPGNPVSSFVCLFVYIRFWLFKSIGADMPALQVKLLREVQFKPDLVYFPEGKLISADDGTLGVTPILGNGSGDFANLVNTDGFLVLPQEKTEFKKGEVYPFIPYRNIF